MRNQVFKYLSQCSTQPNEVDRLIISAFLHINKIIVKKNEFLKSFIIQDSETKEYLTLQKFISIIELEIPKFEFEEFKFNYLKYKLAEPQSNLQAISHSYRNSSCNRVKVVCKYPYKKRCLDFYVRHCNKK